VLGKDARSPHTYFFFIIVEVLNTMVMKGVEDGSMKSITLLGGNR